MCQALHVMATYDQLNMPNIAVCELLNLRRQLIESAHEFNPQRARAEVLEQARKAKEERSFYLTRSYDPKGKGKGKDSGPDPEGDK